MIADQFEELFRYRNLQPSSGGGQSSEEKSVAFVNLLLEAASSHSRIYVVMTMRSDFLGDCAQFFGLPEAINRGQYLVPRMSRDERRSAIEGPVRVAGAEITPVLLTRLVNDVGDNPDQLSILQHALNRTWAFWQGEGGHGTVDLPHYIAIGTMTEALDRHAEKAYAELHDDHQKATCEKVFLAITDKGTDARGIRRPTRAGTLCAIAHVSMDDLTGVLSVFRKPSRSFVMPPESKSKTINPETVIDISHESLMRVWKRLGIWVDEEAESSAQYKRLVENAERYQQKKSKLMTGPELSLMRKWQRERQPTEFWAEQYKKDGFDSAIAFLGDSYKRQVISRVSLGVLIAGVLAGVFWFYHYNQQNKRNLALKDLDAANAKALATKEHEANVTQTRLTKDALDAKQEALHQKELAQAADKLAELERRKVMIALNALAAAQTALKEKQEKKRDPGS